MQIMQILFLVSHWTRLATKSANVQNIVCCWFLWKSIFYVDSYKNDSRCFGSSLHYAVYQGNEEFVKWVILFMMIIVIKMIMLMTVILLSRLSCLLFQTHLVEGRRCQLDIRARLHSPAHGRSTSSSIVSWSSPFSAWSWSFIMILWRRRKP